MNQKLTPPKNVSKMTPADGRFACYWWSAKQSGVAWHERKAACRAACAKTEDEIKSIRKKAEAIREELIKDEKRPKFDLLCLSKAELDAKEAERCLITEDCNTWEIGENIRKQCIKDEEVAANVAKHHGKDDAVIKTPEGVNVEELLWGASDHVRERFKLTDGYMPVIEDSLFRQCAEVARLAVELARLEWMRYKKAEAANPNDQLKNAAELIQRSAALIAVHPEHEKRDAQVRFRNKLEGGRVPIAEIVGPEAEGVNVQTPDGTRFFFRPYDDNTTMKGFAALVRQHLQRLNPDVDEDGVNEIVNEWTERGIPHGEMVALAESRKLANHKGGGGASNFRARKEHEQKKPKTGRK